MPGLRNRVDYLVHCCRLKALMVFLLLGLAVMSPQSVKASGTWSITGSMATARFAHSAILLPNGKVLVVGGTINGVYLSSAEIYDPAAGTWSNTGSMSKARIDFTATLLPNGKVLVAGGYDNNPGYFNSAEIYDPATGTWSPTGSMNKTGIYAQGRSGHTATLLPNGKVLVAGGVSHNAWNGMTVYNSDSELYDPAKGTWSGTGSMKNDHYHHTATLMLNSKVLVAGGITAGGNSVITAEFYDPITQTWSSTGSMNMGRYGFTATLLPNGRALAVGPYTNTVELFTQESGTWSYTGSLSIDRAGQTATLLSDGQVLVAGGIKQNGSVQCSAELYDYATGSWNPTGSMSNVRGGHTAILLPNGQVLVAGGGVASAELYTSNSAIPILSFGLIPSPQTVGVAFPVTINAWTSGGALDTTFNGQVTLSCQVPLDKSLITLNAGRWSGDLTVLGNGADLVLKAMGGGRSGSSNPFTTSQAVNVNGSLSGRVMDDGAIPQPVPGAVVTLAGAQTFTTVADSNGYYAFSGIPVGSYYLSTTPPGQVSRMSASAAIGSPLGAIIYLAGRTVQNIVLPLLSDPGKYPTILIPGIMGSTSDPKFLYPRLQGTDISRKKLKLYDWLLQVGWGDLKLLLQQRGVKVVECPWDWREEVPVAVEKYLKDAIKEAQTGPDGVHNPAQKVNLIAHSMGGLLVRQYIQSYPEASLDSLPVANVIILGTPHRGSANAYYLWEGGDPKTVDAALSNNWLNDTLSLSVYTRVSYYLLLDSHRFTGFPASSYFFTGPSTLDERLKTRQFIFGDVPSLRQLLPTYQFLNENGVLKSISGSADVNNFLNSLNTDDTRYRMGPPGTSGKIPARVYYSESENTIGTIPVSGACSLFYEDGNPIPNRTPLWTAGDGTVPETAPDFLSRRGGPLV